MKKIIALLLCAAALTGLTGCAGGADKGESFDAVILEVNGNSVWAAVDEASPLHASADQVVFSSEGLEDIGAEAGDLVTVVFSGEVMESYPAQVSALSWAMKEKDYGMKDGTELDRGEPVADAAGDAGEEFSALLGTIAANYEPGTAGCSLKAAKYAGMLLDLKNATSLEATQITALSGDFYKTLAEDAATEFYAKLEDVRAAASELTGEEAKDLLESAGYEAQALPYDEANANALFDAIFAGMQ